MSRRERISEIVSQILGMDCNRLSRELAGTVSSIKRVDDLDEIVTIIAILIALNRCSKGWK